MTDIKQYTDDFGHILIYAPTNGGKTTMCKYLLQLYGFENIFIFTTSQDYEEFEPECNQIQVFGSEGEFNTTAESIFGNNQYKKTSKNCVVFDDFNEVINVQQNKLYKDMFQRGRHKGVRVINICHHSKAIGPTARSQTRYVFISAGIQREECKKLNEMFFNLPLMEFTTKLEQINYNTRNYLIYDVQRKMFLEVDSETFKERTEDLSDQETQNQHNLINEITPHPQSTLGQGGQPNYFSAIDPVSALSGQGIGSMLNKSAGRDFTDNSKNVINIENRIKIQQRFEDQHVTNTMQLIQIQHKDKLKRKELLYETKSLLYKEPKNLQDIQGLIQGLTILLRPEKPINHNNWQKYASVFMETYFHEKYSAHKKETQKKDPLKSILPDVALIGQQIVVSNSNNILETFHGLSNVVSKYMQ